MTNEAKSLVVSINNNTMTFHLSNGNNISCICIKDEYAKAIAKAVQEQAREIERLTGLVYVPGHWQCAKCKCYVVSTDLHYPSGGFSANNEPHECPNGCGPMWRVTERDAGNRLIDRMDEAAEAKQAAERELAEARRMLTAAVIKVAELPGPTKDTVPENQLNKISKFTALQLGHAMGIADAVEWLRHAARQREEEG